MSSPAQWTANDATGGQWNVAAHESSHARPSKLDTQDTSGQTSQPLSACWERRTAGQGNPMSSQCRNCLGWPHRGRSAKFTTLGGVERRSNHLPKTDPDGGGRERATHQTSQSWTQMQCPRGGPPARGPCPWRKPTGNRPTVTEHTPLYLWAQGYGVSADCTAQCPPATAPSEETDRAQSCNAEWPHCKRNHKGSQNIMPPLPQGLQERKKFPLMGGTVLLSRIQLFRHACDKLDLTRRIGMGKRGSHRKLTGNPGVSDTPSQGRGKQAPQTGQTPPQAC